MNSIQKKIRFHQPEKLPPLLGTEKIEENWFTSSFSNAFHKQKKKLLSKYTQFEINPKSVYTSHDEGFDKNSVSFHRKKLLPLAGISEKTEENGFKEYAYCSYLKIGLNLIS